MVVSEHFYDELLALHVGGCLYLLSSGRPIRAPVALSTHRAGDTAPGVAVPSTHSLWVCGLSLLPCGTVSVTLTRWSQRMALVLPVFILFFAVRVWRYLCLFIQ